MALGDPYITAAELKTYIGGITGAGQDTSITNAVNAASRWIGRYCGRDFNDAGTASARQFQPDDRRCLTVDDFHTTAGLVVKSDEGDDGTFETTWSSSDYELFPVNGIRDGHTGWPYTEIRAVESRWWPTRSQRRYTVEVTARWGWAAVPADVKQACFQLATQFYKEAEAAFGIAGANDFGIVRIGQGVFPAVERMLLPYRRGVLVA